MATFSLENAVSDEIVHQRCIILKGVYSRVDCVAGSVTVNTKNSSGQTIFPEQTWIVADDQVNIIAMLCPGYNKLLIRHDIHPDIVPYELALTYVPLTQVPPLHLAILIAKDSPLVIDCPASKHGGLSTAHSSLDAAVAKLRMTAYMWQAKTAEDMRLAGFGRRSFRLEEEWTADTVSQAFVHGRHRSVTPLEGAMRATAKVHLVRSDRTVAELRDTTLRGQVDEAGTEVDGDEMLHRYFVEALTAYGHPFIAPATSVVAGLVLDTSFSKEHDLALAHARQPHHRPSGVSLGLFGSHMTFSWPSSLEDVASCLLDDRSSGFPCDDEGGDDLSLWQVCALSQLEFLHDVGHAFSEELYESDDRSVAFLNKWRQLFVAPAALRTGTDGYVVVDGDVEETRWDTMDLLSFKRHPHFWLPDDGPVPHELSAEPPVVSVEFGDSEWDDRLVISSSAGVARIQFDGADEAHPTAHHLESKVSFSAEDLFVRFSKPLTLSATSGHGISVTVENVWKLFKTDAFLRVPCTGIKLKKFSVLGDVSADDGRPYWEWVTLLARRGDNGPALERCTKIDIHTGYFLEGLHLHFGLDGGHRTNCGPVIRTDGMPADFSGHAAESIEVPAGVEIAKIRVSRQGGDLRGMLTYLTNGDRAGKLLGNLPDGNLETHTLKPPAGERIVGFFGRSNWGHLNDCLVEFGILTYAKDLELPSKVYDIKTMQNIDGGEDILNSDTWRSIVRRKMEESSGGDEDSGEDTDDGDSSFGEGDY